MSTQKPKNHKRFVLELLQSHAGNAKGFETDEFFIRVMEETGLSPQSIEKILTEQTGSVWKDKGRIYVIKDALLVSESNSSRRRPQHFRTGEGISNRLKTQWEWPRRRLRKES